MSWQDFLYTKGITETDLTAEQRKYWHGLWQKESGPPKTSSIPADAPEEPLEDDHGRQ